MVQAKRTNKTASSACACYASACIVVQNICTKPGKQAMLTVNISELRANLLKYLEKASHGEQITVTTNGRVLATIAPPSDRKAMARKQLSELSATAKIQDVTSPLDDQWDSML
ncbi:type II toxin-antitoxin system Phd/YefM family antitoxin [Ketobacter nezhaii]|uniref:type II toxin-antitoxin system Phd/YefM family antitoxin n=1 Tax=Ketobacter sp. MCCC 1A13808 TaxID=2602738 RepID=UPI0018DC2977|nr:type II toxin-antitoxin system prevent-host-death family antitoxin [Ketobacter sp. MCCC 1A13808]